MKSAHYHCYVVTIYSEKGLLLIFGCHVSFSWGLFGNLPYEQLVSGCYFSLIYCVATGDLSMTKIIINTKLHFAMEIVLNLGQESRSTSILF